MKTLVETTEPTHTKVDPANSLSISRGARLWHLMLSHPKWDNEDSQASYAIGMAIDLERRYDEGVAGPIGEAFFEAAYLYFSQASNHQLN